jgi:hypothetical protein
VSDSKRATCHSGHPSIGGHRVAWCDRSAYVSHAPLGLGFNGSFWFRRQLKNRRLLTLIQCGQENDLAVRKFQSVVMGRDLVFVDLPKGRRLMLDCTVVPRPQSSGQALNLVRKS